MAGRLFEEHGASKQPSEEDETARLVRQLEEMKMQLERSQKREEEIKKQAEESKKQADELKRKNDELEEQLRMKKEKESKKWPECKDSDWKKGLQLAMNGFDFEIHVIALCYLRCLASCEAFQLTGNVPNFNPFDDIVLTFTHQQCSHTYLVQLKYRTNRNITLAQLHKRNGKYSLHKYCEGYHKLLRLRERAEEALGGDFDNWKFVLFTNSSLENCGQHMTPDVPDQAPRPHPILNGGAVHRVRNNCNECAGLEEEFLERFRIYEKQPNLQALKSLIEEEIQNANCNTPFKRAVALHFLDNIKKWLCNDKYSLTKESTLLRDAVTAKTENEVESRGIVYECETVNVAIAR